MALSTVASRLRYYYRLHLGPSEPDKSLLRVHLRIGHLHSFHAALHDALGKVCGAETKQSLQQCQC